MPRYPTAQYRGVPRPSAGLSTPVARARPLPATWGPRSFPGPRVFPANDNVPGFGRGGGGRLPPGWTRAAGRWLPRIAGRFIPGLGIALTAYELYQWWTDVPGGPDLSNYTMVCSSSSTGPGPEFWTNFGGPGCDTSAYGWSDPGVVETFTDDIPPGDYPIVFKMRFQGNHPLAPPAELWKTLERWDRIGSPGPSPHFSYEVGRPPFYQPGVGTPLPSLFPEDLPIMQPAPTPQRPPLLRPEPGTQPSQEPDERTRRDHRTRPTVVPNTPTLPFPVTHVPPVVYPPGSPPVVIQPDPQVIEVDPGGWREDPPGPPTEPVTNQPPRAGVKERKLNIRSVAGRLWAVIGAATETLDFFYVLWRAIPEHLRSDRHAGIYQHMADLYNQWDHIPIAEAVEGYINNWVEDYYFGQLGRRTGQVTRNLGITTGLNRALKTGQELQGELDRKGKNDDFNPIPQLDYDPKNGWSVTWDLLPGGQFGD